MSALTHILVAVAYTLIATTIAVVVPRWYPELGSNMGIVLGGAILMGAALLHKPFLLKELTAALGAALEAARALR